eukprot:10533901-Alexandrium_andersonii.AAC.1
MEAAQRSTEGTSPASPPPVHRAPGTTGNSRDEAPNWSAPMPAKTPTRNLSSGAPHGLSGALSPT